MAAKKKKTSRKKKAVEKEIYQIEIKDWEVYYHFGVEPRDITHGTYWEISKLTLKGKLLSPKLKNASIANVDISADPEQEDHWSMKPTIISAKAIGFMEIPRGKETLQVYCSIPPRLSNNVHVAVAYGKIKYVNIFGTKLKWQRGDVMTVSLSTIPDE